MRSRRGTAAAHGEPDDRRVPEEDGAIGAFSPGDLATHDEEQHGAPAKTLERSVLREGPALPDTEVTDARSSLLQRVTGGNLVYTVISVTGFVLLWHVASKTGMFGRFPEERGNLLLPGPIQVAETFVELFRTGDLVTNVWVSVQRVLTGFGISFVVAVPLAAAMALIKPVEKLVYPIMALLQPIPGIAWIPLAVVWFGLSGTAAIYIIIVSAFFPLLISLHQGILDINRTLINAALTLGANRRQVIIRVAVPATLPALVTGSRIAMGYAWRGVVAAELVGVPLGIGYMLTLGRGVGRTDITLVVMVCLAVLMFIVDRVLFLPLERRFRTWRV